MTEPKFIYYTGASCHIPQRFWSYTVMTEKEFSHYRKSKDLPYDLKKIPYTPEKWEELTNH